VETTCGKQRDLTPEGFPPGSVVLTCTRAPHLSGKHNDQIKHVEFWGPDEDHGIRTPVEIRTGRRKTDHR